MCVKKKRENKKVTILYSFHARSTAQANTIPKHSEHSDFLAQGTLTEKRSKKQKISSFFNLIFLREKYKKWREWQGM